MSEQKQKTLKNHLDIYLRSLGSKDNSQVDELEIRFGTNHKNKITKIKFDNVIEKLYSLCSSSVPFTGYSPGSSGSFPKE